MTDPLRIHREIPWWFDLIRRRIAEQRRGPWLMQPAAHHELDLDRPFYSQFPEQYHVIDVMVRSI